MAVYSLNASSKVGNSGSSSECQIAVINSEIEAGVGLAPPCREETAEDSENGAVAKFPDEVESKSVNKEHTPPAHQVRHNKSKMQN